MALPQGSPACSQGSPPPPLLSIFILHLLFLMSQMGLPTMAWACGKAQGGTLPQAPSSALLTQALVTSIPVRAQGSQCSSPGPPSRRPVGVRRDPVLAGRFQATGNAASHVLSLGTCHTPSPALQGRRQSPWLLPQGPLRPLPAPSPRGVAGTQVIAATLGWRFPHCLVYPSCRLCGTGKGDRQPVSPGRYLCAPGRSSAKWDQRGVRLVVLGEMN